MLRISILVAAFVVGVLPAYADDEHASPSAAPEDLDAKTAVIAAAVVGVAVDGWRREAPVERYVVANLYDKIDGRSELFMAYGVMGLAFATFKNTSDPAQYVDLYLYDMGSAAGAFGVYSVERWPGMEALELGRGGYGNGADVFFWKGRYYASVLGSGEEEGVRDAQMAIAAHLANQLDDSDETLWGFDVLPLERVVTDSIQFFMVDALSLGFMTDTYTAEFTFDTTKVSAFVSRAESTEAAQARLEDFVAYLRRYGASVESIGDADSRVTVGDMGGGFHDAVTRKGRYVAGVTAVPDRSVALRATEAWRAALK